MEDNFKNIDIEKKDQIINSALEEFSKNRFEKASTNNIVKNANISKGLLYYYFKSKKELYEYLQTFVIKIFINALKDKIDWNESDIIERIKQIIMIKLEVANRYPYIINFFNMLFRNKSPQEIRKITLGSSQELYNKIYYHNIDYTKFKDNTDVARVTNIIRLTLEKFAEEQQEKARATNSDIDVKAYMNELNNYMDILRDAFYK